MATANGVEPEKRLCNLCKGPVSDPRSLPCKHVFCKTCLDPLVKGNKIVCPECEQELTLPTTNKASSTNGAPNLDGAATQSSTERNRSETNGSGNTMVVNVKQVRENIQRFLRPPQDLKIYCDFCRPRNIAARVVCQDCNKDMCEKCSDKHRSTPLFKTHKYVILSDRTVCKTHRGELIRIYCEQCHQGVCIICTAGEHSGHDLMDINQTADKKRGHLETWASDFSEVFRDHYRGRIGFNTTHTSLDGKYTSADLAVKQWYNRAVATLNEKCTEILSNMATKKSVEVAKLEEYEGHVDLLEAQQALHDHIVNIKHTGSAAEIVSCSDALPRFPPIFLPNIPVFDTPSFKLANMEAVTDQCVVSYQPTNHKATSAVVGATDSVVMEGMSEEDGSDSDPSPGLSGGIPLDIITIESAGLTKFAEIDLQTRATGITWEKKQDRFYIKEVASTKIYSDVGREIERLDHGWEGEGICIDHKRDLLVVGEYNKLKLYKLHRRDLEGEISFAGFFSSMFTFSVSDVTYCPKGDCYIVSDTATMGSKIMVVDATSRKIVTKGAGNQADGSKLVHPVHIKCDCNTMQSRSLIAISDRDDNNIKMFTASGQFNGTFGTLGSGVGELDQPHGIAFDVEGRLLVADNRNNRVVRFWQEEGKTWWQTVLNTQQLGGGAPTAMELTNDGRLVVVSEFKNQKGKVTHRKALFFSNYK